MYTNEIEKKRSEQITKPLTADELALQITTECIKYVDRMKKTMKTFAHVMNALNYNNPSISDNYSEPHSAHQIASKIKHLVDLYVARNGYNVDKGELSGILQVIQWEFYWREVKPYLLQMMTQNGDIFKTPDLLDSMTGKVKGIFQSLKDKIENKEK